MTTMWIAKQDSAWSWAGYEPPYRPEGGRVFVAYCHFVGWDCISLGAHICWSLPNVEFHLPFAFIRIGWRKDPPADEVKYWTVP